MKKETIKYLEGDINSLYEVITKVNRQTFSDFDINLTDSITISGLALKIFLKDHYNNGIPFINRASVYNDMKKAYYGGITEVYKPSNLDHKEKLYYYDVNSLYPYAALNDMPGLNAIKFSYFNGKCLKELKNNNFGFYYCEIETPLNLYFGLLLVRSNNGLKFPLGTFKGWYFSEELKFVQSKGYKITVINGYHFDRVKDVFNNYINKIYLMKTNATNPVQRQMSKSLLNNLLGRFGISLDKPITKIVNDEEMSQILSLNKVTSVKSLSKDRNMISYNPMLDSEIIKSNNLDIIKILKKTKDREIQSLNVSSVVISAAVNSYAKIYMQNLKLEILSKGGKLYYTDTDSIVTNLELDESFVDSKALDKLKLEHLVNKAIFIASKLYALITRANELIIKAKGVNKASITFDDFKNLLSKNDSKIVTKTQSIKDGEKGYV